MEAITTAQVSQASRETSLLRPLQRRSRVAATLRGVRTKPRQTDNHYSYLADHAAPAVVERVGSPHPSPNNATVSASDERRS